VGSEQQRDGKGIFTRLRITMRRNRLGELMVQGGILSTVQLRYALTRQRSTGAHLGKILLNEKMVSRGALYSILAEQWTLRGIAAFVTVFIAVSSFSAKPARAASTIRDVPAELTLVGTANTAFAPIRSYPALFGTTERRSDNLKAFVKWTGMFTHFEAMLHDRRNQPTIQAWEKALRPFAGLPLDQMASAVNSLANRKPYVTDEANWHVADYWENPIEFFQRGGDCEDYAIAKYVSLRMLGVPEDRMRIAIVQDLEKNVPHAVLILYSNRGPLLLDSQIKDVRYTDSVSRYRPIFTINRTSWWMHSAPDSTMVASAE
jgi:predicted transglutaminase-like cysteine proteinase